MQSLPTTRVTVLGDAAHGMLPTLGMVANTAVWDAERLADAVTGIGGGASLQASLSRYEADMRSLAHSLIPMTVDHDNVFGGGDLPQGNAGR